jgi:hypothetical protein
MNSTVTLTAAIPTVTIFVRHSADCPRAGDNFSKSCRCPKHLRWFANGKQRTKAAKTRAWSVAEERRRELEAQFAASDPSKPLPSNVQTKAAVTIEHAVELFISDKSSQGHLPQGLKKYERELQRFLKFMEKRHKFFPHEITRRLRLARKCRSG